MSGAAAGRRRAGMLSTRFPSLRVNRVLALSLLCLFLCFFLALLCKNLNSYILSFFISLFLSLSLVLSFSFLFSFLHSFLYSFLYSLLYKNLNSCIIGSYRTTRRSWGNWSYSDTAKLQPFRGRRLLKVTMSYTLGVI